MDSKTLLRASVIGAFVAVYIAILIFNFDIFSVYTFFFAVLGGGAGVLIMYRIRFR